ncbi:similar to Saccharomyces cerevisiae YMR115W MGR3 Subunit of the mitochondrial (mt) i-AAA protease supercomplex [Maudiozyma saulgeensis]|uniref:Similar to Saccharomyces cerevisiae YMR115W MGR3 Subunit of the mitochondrial (Mt) i-AAA protease supercomplex n=1 Tax=Maudiozyma saulgeensis TaxID=1789683 RepID=A0A1X7QZK1_9SACH|nr:similar to Saccharomyces cerevisiae YMR115W MGR3 Subunit of the mitochondrial (mt) i-AAA protease supercomplex [Kazachstania saulgeensis]
MDFRIFHLTSRWNSFNRLLRTRSYRFQQSTYKGIKPFRGFVIKSSIIPAGKQQVFGYLGLGLVTIGIWWQYYPHNPYPPGVSKYLRNASWQEIKTKDFKKSIQFYTDALNECLALGYDPVDEKVTGIEIKIGEMFEKLNMKQEETDVYRKLLTKLYNAIKQPDSESRDKKLLIKRDLSVAIKMVENMEATEEVKKSILMKHINLVQDEILTDSPELEDTIKKTNESFFVDLKNKDYDSLMAKLNKSSKVFESFKEEFIVSRDLFTEICTNINDIDNAIHSKMITIGWMAVLGLDREKILMSQANLASLMYMKAENIESHIYHLQKNNNVERNQFNIKNLLERYNNILNLSEKYYQTVLERSKYSRVHFPVGGEGDITLLQARLLSMHGLGVIKLHKGDIPSANKILLETKALAIKYNFIDVQNACDNELQTIAKISV